ncbi:hypothetical protein [Streptomyces sp. NRRL B-1347]|uniref:hypothetical protein n=1 Tax=Streptomyces sp. NRRL B-1347 TaxID=1476877 RepID=UPI0004CC7353|nr:hypothetical protein [Streptomyces sp. NRRL B-1347]
MATPFERALRDAAQALQSGDWPVRQPDRDAAAVVWEQIWIPYQDVLGEKEPEPDRAYARL